MKKQTRVTFSGIDKTTARTVRDGLLQEAINLGNREGVIHPIGEKSLTATYPIDLETFDIIYRYPAMPTGVLLGAVGTTGNIIQISPESIQTITSVGVNKEIYGISHIGDIVIIHHSSGSTYLRYDSSEDEHFTVLEDLPVPQGMITQGSARTITHDECSSFTDAVSEYIEKDSQAKKDGWIEGQVLAVMAWRMADNTYIKASGPIAGIFGSQALRLNNEVSDNYTFENSIYHKMTWRYQFTDSEQSNLNSWKGIISGLCLFVAQPKSLYVVDTELAAYDYESPYYFPPKNGSLETMVQDTMTYHLVHEIPLLAIIEGASSIQVRPELGPIDLLPTKTSLPVDDSSHHYISGKQSYNYNQRNHYGDIVTKFSSGINQQFFADDGAGYPTVSMILGYDGYDRKAPDLGWELYILTSIKTSKGEKKALKIISQSDGSLTVWRQGDDPGSDMILLAPILSYPDIRAYKMQFWLHQEGGLWYENQLKTGGYELTPHQFHNFASYTFFDEKITPRCIPLSTSVEGSWSPLAGEPDEISSEDIMIEEPNRLQVTGQNNPFIFPSENSYRIGSDGSAIRKIIAMGEPISSGQFGQFPLYVFTTEGIWTVEQGSGEVLYSSIQYLHPDIADSNIINIGNAVLYATKSGLFMLSGNQRQLLSRNLHGRNENPIIGNSTYSNFLSAGKIDSALLSEEEFLSVLPSAVLGYDRDHREVIVSIIPTSDASVGDPGDTPISSSGPGGTIVPDPSGEEVTGFSYVLNLDTMTWTKISKYFSKFLVDHPRYFGVVENKLYDVNEESDADIVILMQTRPMMVGSHTLKKVTQAILHGHISASSDTIPTIYIYGSTDGKKWHLLQGQQLSPGSYDYIPVQRSVGWVRYIIMVLSCTASISSQIECLDIEYQERYLSKLR